MINNQNTAIYHLAGENISPVIEKILNEAELNITRIYFDFADGETYKSAKEVDVKALKEYGVDKALEREKPVAVSINVFDTTENKSLMFWFDVSKKIMAITAF